MTNNLDAVERVLKAAEALRAFERLRQRAEGNGMFCDRNTGHLAYALHDALADLPLDAIERLRAREARVAELEAERDDLREMLEEACECDQCEACECDRCEACECDRCVEARAALAGEEKP